MSVAIENLVGVGLYTPAEAAYFARIKPQMMSRWIFGNSLGEPVVDAQLREYEDKVVTFLDLIQALAIRSIRLRFKTPLTKIRSAVQTAKREFNVEYPFALRHKTFLFNGEILIQLGNKELVQLSNPGSNQRMFSEVAELYMSDLTYDESGLACEYMPYPERNGLKIVIDPKKHCGQPFINKFNGYTISAILNAYRAEGSIDTAAESLGVPSPAVHLALEYDDHLRGADAA